MLVGTLRFVSVLQDKKKKYRRFSQCVVVRRASPSLIFYMYPGSHKRANSWTYFVNRPAFGGRPVVTKVHPVSPVVLDSDFFCDWVRHSLPRFADVFVESRLHTPRRFPRGRKCKSVSLLKSELSVSWEVVVPVQHRRCSVQRPNNNRLQRGGYSSACCSFFKTL